MIEIPLTGPIVTCKHCWKGRFKEEWAAAMAQVELPARQDTRMQMEKARKKAEQQAFKRLPWLKFIKTVIHDDLSVDISIEEEKKAEPAPPPESPAQLAASSGSLSSMNQTAPSVQAQQYTSSLDAKSANVNQSSQVQTHSQPQPQYPRSGVIQTHFPAPQPTAVMPNSSQQPKENKAKTEPRHENSASAAVAASQAAPSAFVPFTGTGSFIRWTGRNSQFGVVLVDRSTANRIGGQTELLFMRHEAAKALEDNDIARSTRVTFTVIQKQGKYYAKKIRRERIIL